MIVAQAALAHQRVRDRHFERLGERGQLRRRARRDARRRRRTAPAARPRRARRRCAPAVAASSVGRAIAAGTLLERVDRQVGGEDVHRHVDQHRPGTPGLREMERALHDARQILDAVDAVDALAERPVDLELIGVLVEVDLLMRMAAVVVRRHVAGDHDHRDRIERGVGDAGGARWSGPGRGASAARRACPTRARSRRRRARRPARGASMTNRMRLLPSASSNAMIVWPHRPKITSTPRRSRYSVSRYEAIRVSVAGRGRLDGMRGDCAHTAHPVAVRRFRCCRTRRTAPAPTAGPRQSAG